MVRSIKVNLLIMKSWDKAHDTLQLHEIRILDIFIMVNELFNTFIKSKFRLFIGEMDGHGRLR